MNEEQIAAHERINGQIAKLCGWTVSPRGWWSHPALPDNGGGMAYPPDYCGDLNAICEATRSERGNMCFFFDYQKALFKEVFPGFGEDHIYRFSLVGFDMIHATAKQRAIAFLKTKGIQTTE
jgi:hypothetical protein